MMTNISVQEGYSLFMGFFLPWLIIGISGWLDACNDGWKWYGNTDLTEENDTQDTDNDDRILIPQIHPT